LQLQTKKEEMKTFPGGFALIITTLALAVTSPIGAGERLTMRVNPTVAMAPATLVITAMARPDSANCGLRIQVDSPQYYRSSLMEMDGDRGNASETVRYERVPGGIYEIRATLFGPGGEKRAETAQTVRILAPGDSEER
jgi:hypothetical protein